MIGLFVNTIPVRIHFDGKTSFNELLQNIQQNDIESKPFHYFPLADIQADNVLKQHLIDHVYAFENFPVAERVEEITGKSNNGINIKLSGFHTFAQTNYPFNIVISAEAFLTIQLIYNSNVYGDEGIRRLGDHFKYVLDQVLTDEQLCISEIELALPQEKEVILYKFNNTCVDYPGEKNLNELFEENVVLTPGRVALVNENLHMTYGELSRISNRLGCQLMKNGVNAGTLAALIMDRSIEWVMGILGIIKAGGVYFPIDPATPLKRMGYLLSDSAAPVIITGEALFDPLSHFILNEQNNGTGTGGVVLRMDDLLAQSKEEYHVNLPGYPGGSTLAYIMYTSGSTGRPKGVLVEHRNVIRLVKNTNFIEFNEKDWLLTTGAPDFDASTLELWGPLLNGSSMVPAKKEDILDSRVLKELIRKYRITMMWMTSPLFNQMSDLDIEIFNGIRLLIVGGDVLSPIHINRLLEFYPGIQIVNGYGPTENTTFSVTHPVSMKYHCPIPIGRPINNSTAYVVDKNRHLLPVGVAGELYVGGDGVARGYLNNPDLTDEKFGVGLFKDGERFYKTGDIARFCMDETIEYIGRIDHQIKIRGHRIELKEIENRLTRIENIKEAVIKVFNASIGVNKEQGIEKWLCAYFVSNFNVDTTQLRKTLADHLPIYMVPTYFIQVEKIPLTSNGKVDLSALPDPLITESEKYITPRNDCEKKLVQIWSEILGVNKDSIGIDDNFFDLGGHSLKATLLVSKIHREFDLQVPLMEIFTSPTIRELSEYMKRVVENKYISIKPVEKKEYYDLSSAQKRQFYLDQFEKIGTAFNVPSALRFKGKLDIHKINLTVKRLIERHESLRTSFEIIHDKPVQRIHDNLESRVEILPWREIEENQMEKLIKSFIRPFDLSKAPLLRIGIVELSMSETFVLFDMHHIISDGVSMEILKEDLKRIYSGQNMEPLEIQYKDFSEWQNHLYDSEQIKDQEEYWVNQFRDANQVRPLNLPYDFSRPANMNYTTGQYAFGLKDEEAIRFRSLISQTQTTLYMNVLAVLAILLYKYTGTEKITIGTGVAGRKHDSLQGIIGFFINLLAICSFPNDKKTYAEFLNEVKTTCINAFERQDFQFEKLIERLKLQRDYFRNPLFNVSLTVQNFKPQSNNVNSDNSFILLKMEQTPMNVDLNFLIGDMNNEIYFHVDYLMELFKKETIIQLVADYLKIIDMISRNKDIEIGRISLSNRDEKERLALKIQKDQEFFSRIQEVDFNEIF